MNEPRDPSKDSAREPGPPKHFAIAIILGAIAISIAVGFAVWVKRFIEPAAPEPAPAKPPMAAPK